VYCHGSFWWLAVRDAIRGQWRVKMRPEAWIFAGRELWKGWTVMDRLDLRRDGIRVHHADERMPEAARHAAALLESLGVPPAIPDEGGH
jgi:hypothetical protein